MLTRFVSFVASLLVATSALAGAAQEGVNYLTLKTPLPQANGTLIKIWSYTCPFCYRFETSVDPVIVPAVQASTGLQFTPIHLDSKGAQAHTISLVMAALVLDDRQHQRTLMSPDSLFGQAAQALGDQYHKMRVRWQTPQEVLAVVSKATGLSMEALQAMMAKPEVQAYAKQAQHAEEVARLQGIPAYVVNGKYLVINQSLTSAQSLETLVEELAKLPH